MSVQNMIHVIPMLTVPTLLEVSLARVSQVLREMEWPAQVTHRSLILTAYYYGTSRII